MFVMVEDNSKNSDDPHKVYRIKQPLAVATNNAPATASKDGGYMLRVEMGRYGSKLWKELLLFSSWPRPCATLTIPRLHTGDGLFARTLSGREHYFALFRSP